MTVYGKDFAAAYNNPWAFWGPKMWAFLSPVVAKRLPGAKTWLDLCCGAGSLLRLVVAGGIFALDMNTFAGLRDQWCGTSAIHERDFTIMTETSFDSKRALGRCLITGFVRDGKRYRKFQEEHIERGYHAGEIEDLLESAGFSFRKYDGHRFTRPRKQSARLLYICKTKS